MNERERDKNAAPRLAILRHAEEVTGNVALTCRYYGITRQVFYLWRRRYEAGGLDACCPSDGARYGSADEIKHHGEPMAVLRRTTRAPLPATKPSKPS